ncbi:MAG: hypothetical protein K6A82_01460 [Prevotella sp.]|nr:hypothetical protein [Prevotella sp.]
MTNRQAEGLSVTAQTAQQWMPGYGNDESLRVNYRTGKWDFFQRFGYGHDNSKTHATSDIDYDWGAAQRLHYDYTSRGWTDKWRETTGMSFTDANVSFGAQYEYVVKPYGSSLRTGETSLVADSGTKSQSMYSHSYSNGHNRQLDAYLAAKPFRNTDLSLNFTYYAGNSSSGSKAQNGEASEVSSNAHLKYKLYTGKLTLQHHILWGSFQLRQ